MDLEVSESKLEVSSERWYTDVLFPGYQVMFTEETVRKVRAMDTKDFDLLHEAVFRHLQRSVYENNLAVDTLLRDYYEATQNMRRLTNDDLLYLVASGDFFFDLIVRFNIDQQFDPEYMDKLYPNREFQYRVLPPYYEEMRLSTIHRPVQSVYSITAYDLPALTHYDSLAIKEGLLLSGVNLPIEVKEGAEPTWWAKAKDKVISILYYDDGQEPIEKLVPTIWTPTEVKTDEVKDRGLLAVISNAVNKFFEATPAQFTTILAQTGAAGVSFGITSKILTLSMMGKPFSKQDALMSGGALAMFFLLGKLNRDVFKADPDLTTWFPAFGVPLTLTLFYKASDPLQDTTKLLTASMELLSALAGVGGALLVIAADSQPKKDGRRKRKR